MAEREIEEAIIRDPAALGYKNARIVRNARVSPESGRVDLMILPVEGNTKIALVEAKQARSPDASSKLVGQLIMYYTAALQIGTRGLALIQDYAKSCEKEALSSRNTSLNKLSGGAKSQRAAWELLQEGRKLTPKQIELFLALDNYPRTKLLQSLTLLKQNHGLRIRVVVANERGVRIVSAV